MGLDLAPHKSQAILFSRAKKLPDNIEPLFVHGSPIPLVDSVRFLGISLDRKLSGDSHLRFLINKGYKISKIITSLSGVWWGAHPLLLLAIYRAVFRSSIEYGAQILKLHRNRSLFLKIQRQQYRIIRTALGLRQSTPINVLLAESCEPPLELRFAFLSSRYVFKCLSMNQSLVVRSFRQLEIESLDSTRQRRTRLLRSVPTFRPYILQKYYLNLLWRSVSSPPFAFGYSALLPTPHFASFGSEDSTSRREDGKLSISILRKKFQAFAAPLINDDILLYTDGSKREGDDSSAGAAVYSPELGLAITHKLPPETSIFSAEAWAVYQALILVESFPYSEAAIFSNSRSVLDALLSFSLRSCSNYLIPLIR